MLLHSRQYSRVPSLPRVSRTPNLRIFAREDADFPTSYTLERGIPVASPSSPNCPTRRLRGLALWHYGKWSVFCSSPSLLFGNRIQSTRSRLSFCFEMDVGESRLTGKVGNWRPRKRNNLCEIPPRLIRRRKSVNDIIHRYSSICPSIESSNR